MAGLIWTFTVRSWIPRFASGRSNRGTIQPRKLHMHIKPKKGHSAGNNFAVEKGFPIKDRSPAADRPFSGFQKPFSLHSKIWSAATSKAPDPTWNNLNHQDNHKGQLSPRKKGKPQRGRMSYLVKSFNIPLLNFEDDISLCFNSLGQMKPGICPHRACTFRASALIPFKFPALHPEG